MTDAEPTSNVVALPGVFRADMEPRCEPRDVLTTASAAPLIDVVVIGRQVDGDLYVASSAGDSDKVIGLAMRGVHWLAEATQIASEESGKA